MLRGLLSAAPAISVFDRHRSAIFYLVVAVFCLVDLLQITLTLPAAPGVTTPRIVGLIALASFGAITLFYRLTGKLKTASVAILGATYAGIVYAALKQGGAPAPTLIYAPFLPIVATVLLGRAAGIVSVFISIAALAFCAYAAGSGLATPSPNTPAELRLLYTSAAALLTVGVLVYALVYELLIAAALKAADDAKKAVEANAEQLAESRDFLSAVMECVSDGIIAADVNKRLTIFNRAARAFDGLEPSPETEEEWAAFYHAYHPDKKTLMTTQELPLVRALNGEKVTDCEIALCPPGEEPRIVLVSASPLSDKKAEHIGAVAIVKDITHERLQEAEIRTQNREIDQFARVASLDLQAPLNRIIMTSEALANSPEVRASAKTRTDLAAVTAAARKMGALIKDVLYMSRLPIGEISLQPVAARDCIEAAIDLAGLSEADCRLDFRFTGSPEVMADPQSLTHVFKNLIENVWKHSTPGVRAHAEFTCVIEDGFAVLGVKDNGCGMTQEQVDRLFIPLERIRTDEDSAGSGLGLAICRKSLARMNGEIWVETQPGKGCHFRLRLPLAQRQAVAAS